MVELPSRESTSVLWQVTHITGWRSVKGYIIFSCHFPQKSPVISGSLAASDLQLKASYESSPPCTHRVTAFV